MQLETQIPLSGEQSISYQNLEKLYLEAKSNLEKSNLLDFSNTKHTQYVDSIVFNRFGQFLILKRIATAKFEPGKWCLPGGHLDSTDNSLIEGAKRELQEETNIIISEDNPFAANHTLHFKNPDNSTTDYFIFSASDTGVVLQIEEQAYYEWIFPNEIDSFCFLLDLQNRLKHIFSVITLPKPHYTQIEKLTMEINQAILTHNPPMPDYSISNPPILEVGSELNYLKKSLDEGFISHIDYIEAFHELKIEEGIEKSFQLEDEETLDFFEKGRKAANLETVAERPKGSGRFYIKTLKGWKWYGKGTSMAVQHHLFDIDKYRESGVEENRAKRLEEKAAEKDTARKAHKEDEEKNGKIVPEPGHKKEIAGRMHIRTHDHKWKFYGNGKGNDAQEHERLALKHREDNKMGDVDMSKAKRRKGSGLRQETQHRPEEKEIEPKTEKQEVQSKSEEKPTQEKTETKPKEESQEKQPEKEKSSKLDIKSHQKSLAEKAREQNESKESKVEEKIQPKSEEKSEPKFEDSKERANKLSEYYSLHNKKEKTPEDTAKMRDLRRRQIENFGSKKSTSDTEKTQEKEGKDSDDNKTFIKNKEGKWVSEKDHKLVALKHEKLGERYTKDQDRHKKEKFDDQKNEHTDWNGEKRTVYQEKTKFKEDDEKSNSKQDKKVEDKNPTIKVEPKKEESKSDSSEKVQPKEQDRVSEALKQEDKPKELLVSSEKKDESSSKNSQEKPLPRVTEKARTLTDKEQKDPLRQIREKTEKVQMLARSKDKNTGPIIKKLNEEIAAHKEQLKKISSGTDNVQKTVERKEAEKKEIKESKAEESLRDVTNKARTLTDKEIQAPQRQLDKKNKELKALISNKTKFKDEWSEKQKEYHDERIKNLTSEINNLSGKNKGEVSEKQQENKDKQSSKKELTDREIEIFTKKRNSKDDVNDLTKKERDYVSYKKNMTGESRDDMMNRFETSFSKQRTPQEIEANKVKSTEALIEREKRSQEDKKQKVKDSGDFKTKIEQEADKNKIEGKVNDRGDYKSKTDFEKLLPTLPSKESKISTVSKDKEPDIAGSKERPSMPDPDGSRKAITDRINAKYAEKDKQRAQSNGDKTFQETKDQLSAMEGKKKEAPKVSEPEKKDSEKPKSEDKSKEIKSETELEKNHRLSKEKLESHVRNSPSTENNDKALIAWRDKYHELKKERDRHQEVLDTEKAQKDKPKLEDKKTDSGGYFPASKTRAETSSMNQQPQQGNSDYKEKPEPKKMQDSPDKEKAEFTHNQNIKALKDFDKQSDGNLSEKKQIERDELIDETKRSGRRVGISDSDLDKHISEASELKKQIDSPKSVVESKPKEEDKPKSEKRESTAVNPNAEKERRSAIFKEQQEKLRAKRDAEKGNKSEDNSNKSVESKEKEASKAYSDHLKKLRDSQPGTPERKAYYAKLEELLKDKRKYEKPTKSDNNSGAAGDYGKGSGKYTGD